MTVASARGSMASRSRARRSGVIGLPSAASSARESTPDAGAAVRSMSTIARSAGSSAAMALDLAELFFGGDHRHSRFRLGEDVSHVGFGGGGGDHEVDEAGAETGEIDQRHFEAILGEDGDRRRAVFVSKGQEPAGELVHPGDHFDPAMVHLAAAHGLLEEGAGAVALGTLREEAGHREAGRVQLRAGCGPSRGRRRRRQRCFAALRGDGRRRARVRRGVGGRSAIRRRRGRRPHRGSGSRPMRRRAGTPQRARASRTCGSSSAPSRRPSARDSRASSIAAALRPVA